MTLSLHDSITLSLHDSMTLSLHDSITPSLHDSITPSLHESFTRRHPRALSLAFRPSTPSPTPDPSTPQHVRPSVHLSLNASVHLSIGSGDTLNVLPRRAELRSRSSKFGAGELRAGVVELDRTTREFAGVAFPGRVGGGGWVKSEMIGDPGREAGEERREGALSPSLPPSVRPSVPPSLRPVAATAAAAEAAAGREK
jgi:hypothetical protein